MHVKGNKNNPLKLFYCTFKYEIKISPIQARFTEITIQASILRG